MPAPGTIDTARPSMARVWHHWLGGCESYAADRDLAARIEAAYPPPAPGRLPVPAEAAVRSRQFLDRAVTWAAREGTGQFLDLGAGMPADRGAHGLRPRLRSVHAAARSVLPGARVVYADIDPVVVLHARAHLSGVPGTAVTERDLADPAGVLADAGGLLDLARPVALVASMVAHLFDAALFAALMAEYVSALAPGSAVIIAVPRLADEGLHERLQALRPVQNHDAASVRSFFGGVPLVPPGLVPAPAWRPACPARLEPDAAGWVIAGAGVKQ